MPNIIPLEKIENSILLMRDKKVMLDRDLASFYGTETRALIQAVKRNAGRFPEDFMFQLLPMEAESLVSQNVIPSKRSLGGRMPYVFTEQGVAMLSSVLKSEKAIKINVIIMRTFVKVRKLVYSYKELADKIRKMEFKYDRKFSKIFDILDKLHEGGGNKPRKEIGLSASNI